MTNFTLNWIKHIDGSYHATANDHTYRIVLEPRPVDRYTVFVDGEVQRAISASQPGEKLLLYYLDEAKQHCQELFNKKSGFMEATSKRVSAMPLSSLSVVPFPSKDEVAAVVRVVTPAGDRVWPIVDSTWDALAAHVITPSASSIQTLKTYATEIAKWGKIHRWLVEGDVSGAARALWDVRGQAIALRGRNYSETGIANEVIGLYSELVNKMQSHGITKRHYSWSSKLLHWLLPACVPVYDSLVMQELRIGVTGLLAYRQIVAWEYECAASLAPFAEEVIGGVEQMTILAAIDNFLWWTGKQHPQAEQIA